MGVVVIALAIFGSAVGGGLWWKSHSSYHLATVQEGVLYRDGFRSPAQFAASLDRVHPRTVVSLLDSKELTDPKKPQFADEEKLCSSRGIRLERIPVTLGGWPTNDDIRRFLKIVDDKQNQPVLVHCAQGVRRTGFFVAAYQESVLGYDRQKAEQAIVAFGHTGSTLSEIRRFIAGYDPQTQSVPAGLKAGME